MVVVAIERVWVVEDATRFARDVVAITPLIFVVSMVPAVLRLLLLMIEDVAVSPFTLVVAMFPTLD